MPTGWKFLADVVSMIDCLNDDAVCRPIPNLKTWPLSSLYTFAMHLYNTKTSMIVNAFLITKCLT